MPGGFQVSAAGSDVVLTVPSTVTRIVVEVDGVVVAEGTAEDWSGRPWTSDLTAAASGR